MTADHSAAQQPLQPRTLPEVLRDNTLLRPDGVALMDYSVSITFTELWERARRFAGGLRAAGVEHGGAVGLMLDNSADYFIAIAGVSIVGATCVPINTAYRGTILEHLLSDSRCSAVIAEELYLDTIAATPVSLKQVIVRSGPGTQTTVPASSTHTFDEVSNGPVIDPVPLDPWDTFAILYTSGTTGKSKGAVISHAHAYQASYWPDVSGPHDDGDVFLVICPIFHITGLWTLWAAYSIGASAAVVERFSASRFWEDADRFGATTCQMIGAMWDYVLAQPARPDDSTHSLRSIFTVPLPRDAVATMRRFDVEIRTGYGLTEGGSLINWSTVEDVPATLARKGRAAGRLRVGYEMRLVDQHDQEMPVGAPGEAIVRADRPWTMTLGYINNPEASVRLWRNGWLHTGDILRKDEDDWYYFVDRVKDSIRRRGENVSSQEVEAEALAHPEVLECAAVGVGDPAEDQEIKIFVLRTVGSTLDERSLIEFIEPRIPYFSVPRYVAFVGDLPRTPTGKIRKLELPTDAASAWDREEHGYVVSRPSRGPSSGGR